LACAFSIASTTNAFDRLFSCFSKSPAQHSSRDEPKDKLHYEQNADPRCAKCAAADGGVCT
jgi:hypothetical protein